MVPFTRAFPECKRRNCTGTEPEMEETTALASGESEVQATVEGTACPRAERESVCVCERERERESE